MERNPTYGAESYLWSGILPMELAPWTGRGWKKYLLVVGLFSSRLITFRLTSSVRTNSGALSAVDPVPRHGRNYQDSLLVHVKRNHAKLSSRNRDNKICLSTYANIFGGNCN
jgi:hypothetical protein